MSPNHFNEGREDGETPFTLLLDLSGTHWWELLREITAVVMASGTSLRVRSGLVLPPLASRPVRIVMGEYEPLLGRRVRQRQDAYLPYYREVVGRRLLAEVEILKSDGGALRTAEIWNSECVSFASVSSRLAEQLVKLCEDRGVLVAGLTWGSDSPYAGDMLWDGLILRRMIVGDNVITDYEEYPEDLNYSSGEWTWEPTRTPEDEATGFFFDDGVKPNVEPSLRHLALPPEVETTQLVLPPPFPLQRALLVAGNDVVVRISGHDQPGLPSSFELPYIHFQFPDLLAVERKVRDYCLDANHHEGKWVGFMHHGYGLRPNDSIVLAAHIASALLGEFSPKEVVATSHGELQFSVGIAVPSRARHRAPLTTAWIAEPEKGFRLTTAYLDASLPEHADAFPPVDQSTLSVDDWDELLERANMSVPQGLSDGVRARPRIFIPRAHTTRSLAQALVKREDDHGTFKRAILGGRCLLVPLGPEMSWTAAAYVASFVQVHLGLRGVRSSIDVWVD